MTDVVAESKAAAARFAEAKLTFAQERTVRDDAVRRALLAGMPPATVGKIFGMGSWEVHYLNPVRPGRGNHPGRVKGPWPVRDREAILALIRSGGPDGIKFERLRSELVGQGVAVTEQAIRKRLLVLVGQGEIHRTERRGCYAIGPDTVTQCPGVDVV